MCVYVLQIEVLDFKRSFTACNFADSSKRWSKHSEYNNMNAELGPTFVMGGHVTYPKNVHTPVAQIYSLCDRCLLI